MTDGERFEATSEDEHLEVTDDSRYQLRERLAAIAHSQWSGWMRYQFGRRVLYGGGRCTHNTLFVMTMSDEERWARQMETPYSELSEDEKDSDRKEADTYLSVLYEVMDAERARVREIADQIEAVTRKWQRDHYGKAPVVMALDDQILALVKELRS